MSASFQSRDQYKPKKVGDQGRKTGKAQPQLDQSGKQINPYMPQYITQVPWYVDQTNQPTLKHHKFYQPQKVDMNAWYDRGAKGLQATQFRKGACQNCGAMGHQKKQCAERPRKVGAKFTKKEIQPDDIVKKIELDWQGKRDRWNGYNPDRHKQLVEQFQAYEQIKKKKRQQEIQQKAEKGEILEEDEYRQTDNPFKSSNLPSKHDKILTKYHGLGGLRNRQDKAKYLLNLDINSAHFDPKSRSMRQNPNPLLPDEKQIFKGQNAYLNSGQKNQLVQQQLFAWQQSQMNNAELNTIALPSLTEHVYKTVKKRNQIFNSGKTGQLLKKYGGQQYLKNKPTDDIVETEAYFQYNLDGKIKKQKNQNKTKSKYPEDIFINDHTSVWGSWWNEYLGWGYNCCHNTVKMSMCLGLKGREIALQKQYRVKKQKIKQQNEIRNKQQKQKQQKQIEKNQQEA